MQLYGTLTSPFVRRVRVVAHELGVDVRTVDTTTPEGQEALRAVSPIGKVPVAELDGEVVFDSRTIIAEMVALRGPGALRIAGRTEPAESNFVHAVDAALEAAIRLFYFKRDGVAVDGLPYMVKERERVRTIMTWLEGHVHGGWCTRARGFGLAELALVTTLDWMTYRQAYPIADHPRLVAVQAVHADRPSLVATLPP